MSSRLICMGCGNLWWSKSNSRECPKCGSIGSNAGESRRGKGTKQYPTPVEGVNDKGIPNRFLDQKHLRVCKYCAGDRNQLLLQLYREVTDLELAKLFGMSSVRVRTIVFTERDNKIVEGAARSGAGLLCCNVAKRLESATQLPLFESPKMLLANV